MPLNLESFLNEGAFLRDVKGNWILGQGSVVPSAAPTPGKLAFFSPSFFSDSQPSWFVFENAHHLTTGELQKTLEFNPNPKMRSMDELRQLANLTKNGGVQIAQWPWSSADKSVFDHEFKQIMQTMEKDQLEKVVPLTYESCDRIPDPELKKKILHRLLSAGSHLTPYGRWSSTGGMMGCTPEKLLEIKGGTIKTMAVAGTRPSDGSWSLLEDKKEMHEHQLVIEGIRSVLQTHGEINIAETKEWDIGLITHLRTDIQVELKNDVEIPSLIRELHPTPALGGVPKKLAIDWLQNSTTGTIRHTYGAPFGIAFENGDIEIYVAIRNMLWDPQVTRIFSGCGVVKSSQLDREWNELYAKRMSVKAMLGMG